VAVLGSLLVGCGSSRADGPKTTVHFTVDLATEHTDGRTRFNVIGSLKPIVGTTRSIELILAPPGTPAEQVEARAVSVARIEWGRTRFAYDATPGRRLDCWVLVSRRALGLWQVGSFIVGSGPQQRVHLDLMQAEARLVLDDDRSTERPLPASLPAAASATVVQPSPPSASSPASPTMTATAGQTWMLAVNTTPDGATIGLAGRLLGQTPLALSWTEGHVAEVVFQGRVVRVLPHVNRAIQIDFTMHPPRVIGGEVQP